MPTWRCFLVSCVPSFPAKTIEITGCTKQVSKENVYLNVFSLDDTTNFRAKFPSSISSFTTLQKASWPEWGHFQEQSILTVIKWLLMLGKGWTTPHFCHLYMKISTIFCQTSLVYALCADTVLDKAPGQEAFCTVLQAKPALAKALIFWQRFCGNPD